MKTIIKALIGLAALFAAGCGVQAEDPPGVIQSEVLGRDTYLYFRCNATGWGVDDSTRMLQSSPPEFFSLTYQVTQPWMVTGFDTCTFVETNQLNGWGSAQTFYDKRGDQLLVASPSGPVYGQLKSWQQGEDYHFQVKYPATGTYRATVNWANGTFWIEPVTGAGAQHRLPAYPARGVFLVSDEDWRAVLSLVPLTTWHAAHDAEYAACPHPFGGAARVCAYPTLVYHRESTGTDVDPIVHLLEEYAPATVRHAAPLPSDVNALLSSRYQLQPVGNQLDYWSSYPQVVLVNDDYATALAAAPYASLIGAPLLIQGYNDGVNLGDKHVICVGASAASCDEWLDADSVQARYVAESRTTRAILTSAADRSEFVTSEPIALEWTSGSFARKYAGISLGSPFLAAAKEQVNLVIGATSPSATDVNQFLKARLASLGMTAPEYLTIVAGPRVIPQARFGSYAARSGTADYWTQVDGALYGDVDGDLYQDTKVGRVYGYASSDVSAYIARVLFYDRLPHSSQFATVKSFVNHPEYAEPLYIRQALSSLGFVDHSATGDFDVPFDPAVFRDNMLLFYGGHGHVNGGQLGYDTGTFRNERIWLPSTLVVSSTCSSCSFDTGVDSFGLFCAEMIRRGAIGYVGATDLDSSNSRPQVSFVQRVLKGQNFGTAMRDANNLSYADIFYAYSPYYLLVGDPSFDLGLRGDGSQDLLHLSTGELAGGVVPVDIVFDAVQTMAFSGVRDQWNARVDVDTAPFYGGDATFRSLVAYYHQYPDPPDGGGTEYVSQPSGVEVVASFQNPSRRQFVGVISAQRTVGTGAPQDVTADYAAVHLAVTNVQNRTFVYLPLQLGTGIVGPTTTAVPEIRFHLVLSFN